MIMVITKERTKNVASVEMNWLVEPGMSAAASMAATEAIPSTIMISGPVIRHQIAKMPML